MKILAILMTVFVAVSHYGFMALEMFYWNHPVGQKIFDLTPEFAEASAPLAANQGLYNGFLATGFVWGLLSKQTNVIIFFLGCVIVAGIYGGFTAKTSILYVQALPAFIAMVLVWFTRPKTV